MFLKFLGSMAMTGESYYDFEEFLYYSKSGLTKILFYYKENP